MFTFKSPAISKNTWKLYFKPREEMLKIFYEDTEPEENSRILGVTDYKNSTVYIDKELNGFILVKTLRHELMHIYLWETKKKKYLYNETEICEIISVATPLICKLTDNIILRLKKEHNG